MVRKRGEDLLELLRHAGDDAAMPLSAPRRPLPEDMARATRLLQVVRDVATAHEIGAEVLATRRDVEAIAFGA